MGAGTTTTVFEFPGVFNSYLPCKLRICYISITGCKIVGSITGVDQRACLAIFNSISGGVAMKFTRRFLGGFVLAIGIVSAGISFAYAQTVPTIRQVSLSQGAPGTLIELMGQFDTDVEYQVKFGEGEVLVPGYS